MGAVTRTVSFWDDSPGFEHYESLPAGQRSSFVRKACDDAVGKGEFSRREMIKIMEKGGMDTVLTELRALRRDVERLHELMTSRPVTLPSPTETSDAQLDVNSPELDGLANLGL